MPPGLVADERPELVAGGHAVAGHQFGRDVAAEAPHDRPAQRIGARKGALVEQRKHQPHLGIPVVPFTPYRSSEPVKKVVHAQFCRCRTDVEQMVEGAVLLIAVIADALVRRRSATGAR